MPHPAPKGCIPRVEEQVQGAVDNSKKKPNEFEFDLSDFIDLYESDANLQDEMSNLEEDETKDNGDGHSVVLEEVADHSVTGKQPPALPLLEQQVS